MNPSSLRTSATWTLSLVAAISTAGASMRLAFRIRVSMSAIGSVIITVHQITVLPARFLDAGDQAEVGHLAETDPADAELAKYGTGPATDPAAEADADPVARSELRLLRLPLRFLELLELEGVFHSFGFC